MVARLFRGLDPEQMKACGGKPMPKLGGRPLHEDSHAFGEWVRGQVRDYRAEQLAALANAEIQLRASLAEAQRHVALFSEQLSSNASRQAEIRGKPRG